MPPKKDAAALIGQLYEQAGEMAFRINEGVSQEQARRDIPQLEYLNIELLYPDPVQPRRVLPERLHQQLHHQRINPRQAIRELVTMAQLQARSAGRPFGNPFELAISAESEDNTTQDITYTIEEALLRDLVHLSVTLQDDGQVNPLTVVNLSEGVRIQYMIETGERRFWATWLSREFHPVEPHNGKVPCIIVPPNKTSPFRQAKENTSRAGLNAIAMARQVALLLLHVHGREIPFGPVTMDFYRQALDLDLRGKREYTELVLSSLGGMSKRQLSYFKALLALSDEALELADRHNIDEFKLRAIVEANLSDQDQVEITRQVIQLGLTAKQIRDLIEKGERAFTNSDEDPIAELPKSVVQMARLILKPDELHDTHKLIRALVGMERDKQVAKARMLAMRDLLDSAIQNMG